MSVKEKIERLIASQINYETIVETEGNVVIFSAEEVKPFGFPGLKGPTIVQQIEQELDRLMKKHLNLCLNMNDREANYKELQLQANHIRDVYTGVAVALAVLRQPSTAQHEIDRSMERVQ